MREISVLEEIVQNYDAFIIDLWGVVHDGTQLYPGALDAIKKLNELNKKIVFLTNAPRRAQAAEVVLNELGVTKDLYLQVVSSGEVAYKYAASGTHGKSYFYLGPGKDENILAGSEIVKTDYAFADFILCTGFEYDFQPSHEIEPVLQELAGRKLKMLCVNPDYEVVKIDGTRMLCAGAVAQKYEELGGEVIYIGKPFEEVYKFAHTALGAPEKSRVLAIGDSVRNDIKGANNFGVDCVLVLSGLLRGDSEKLNATLREFDAQPEFISPGLIYS